MSTVVEAGVDGGGEFGATTVPAEYTQNSKV